MIFNKIASNTGLPIVHFKTSRSQTINNKNMKIIAAVSAGIPVTFLNQIFIGPMPNERFI